MHEIDQTELRDQTKFRLHEIKKIDNCFINDINQQKQYSNKLNTYFTIFDYKDKTLIVLSATTSGASIISFTNTISESVGIVSANFTLIFSLTTGIIKKLLNMTINKKKKHDQLLMLAQSKFNSIKTLISQALGDLDTSHEEFIMILKGKDKDEKMKYNLISENGDEKLKNCKNKQYKIKKIVHIKHFFFFILLIFLVYKGWI